MPMARAKAPTAAAAKRAVDYTLVLKDADGAYSPVPSGTVFYAGDSVRLQVAPTEVPAQLELLLVLSRVEHVDIDAQTTPTIVIEYR